MVYLQVLPIEREAIEGGWLDRSLEAWVELWQGLCPHSGDRARESCYTGCRAAAGVFTCACVSCSMYAQAR